AGRAMAGRLMTLVSGAGGDNAPLVPAAAGDARRAALEAWCAARTVDEIVTTLLDLGVPVAPVRSIPEVVKDPHVWAREMLVKMEDPVAGEVYVPGVTVKMSHTPGRIGPVPAPGQHTDEVLGRLLGFDAERLQSLREAKVIG
ncbi:MAG: CoA:oxalate CoA-transferase, partial [Acetobacteraceae bacterium]|nr:CoA:oxalate CoA-transferase [Acetobacteraceae bacterium]